HHPRTDPRRLGRPRAGGGKCENGPHPDGTCCNAIPKCQPRRSLRSIRKRVVSFTMIASLLILFVGISRDWRDKFTNPGPLSSVHASATFASIHTKQSGGDTSNCAACHEGARQGADSWHTMAFDAFKHGLTPAQLIKKGPLESSAMDANCSSCHEGKKFHQPNMAAEVACHECHKEHQTSGFMPEVNSAYCTSCHGSSELMAASREKGVKTNPHAFPAFGSSAELKIQPRKRPDSGYTGVITAFDTDHPEFRQIRDGVRDENSLKFNHALHLRTGKIPRELHCSDCHERDGRGEYQQPITYEKNCVECHTLQFDPDTPADGKKPGIYLPHGDPYYVRAFLRSLNIQYEEYGRSHEGIASREELSNYVRGKKVGIEKLYETGENLERAVFFADMKGEIPGGLRAPFAGCATCHDVSEPKSDNATPEIKKVATPDRWMVLGKFNHDMHQKGLTCLDCHNVMDSELTSDLNLPSIKSCVECHSPKGGIDSRCTSCHNFHNSEPGSLSPKSNP
ncbi:MAG: cytochrome c3 family protein, partial [Verrucomicrobiota bacterium]